MGGVDKVDQLLEPYQCARKTMKWSKKLFFHLLQMSLCNGFIAAKKNGYKKPFLSFLEEVIMSWMIQDNVPCATAASDDGVRLRERHFLDCIPPTEKKEKPCRVCVVCSKKGIKRKETRYYCPDCPSKPALCMPECYRLYHTKLVFWM